MTCLSLVATCGDSRAVGKRVGGPVYRICGAGIGLQSLPSPSVVELRGREGLEVVGVVRGVSHDGAAASDMTVGLRVNRLQYYYKHADTLYYAAG